MTKLFHWSEYITQQSQVLLDYFEWWGKIVEIGGQFLHDEFLTQVLPGYEKHSQAKILNNLFNTYPDITLTYCISAKDLVRDKQFSQKYCSFEKYILKELALISSSLHKKAHIVITLMDDDFVPPHVRELEELLHHQWYTTEQYALWTPYHLSHHPTIVTSYDSNTGKSILCASTLVSFTTRAPLRVSYNEHHPLNILAQAYHFSRQNKANISVLEQHISGSSPQQYLKSCTDLITHRIELYEKLFLSGYTDEEEIADIKNLLIYLKE